MRPPKMLINQLEQKYVQVDTENRIECVNPLCKKLLMTGHVKAIETMCPECKTMQRHGELD